jgi:3D (Asp-Asp-Asp) domain-containing protein
MLLSHSGWWRLLATTAVAAGILVAYQATMFDSRYAARQALLREESAEPAPGARLQFNATAYCQGNLTASGVAPRSGIAAADSSLLPVGSVVQIGSLDQHYNGIYTIMDTGPMVQGRRIDIYMWSCTEAQQFGRRPVHVTVLRLGWNPRATTPSLIDTLLPWRGRPAPPAALLPSHPLIPPVPQTLPEAPKPGR